MTADLTLSLNPPIDGAAEAARQRESAASLAYDRLCRQAMKVCGRDYLRIIYGPDPDMPENFERLRNRRQGSTGSAWVSLGYARAIR